MTYSTPTTRRLTAYLRSRDLPGEVVRSSLGLLSRYLWDHGSGPMYELGWNRKDAKHEIDQLATEYRRMT